jgi:alpha-tubulin suppressor-like RCC1 family protein
MIERRLVMTRSLPALVAVLVAATTGCTGGALVGTSGAGGAPPGTGGAPPGTGAAGAGVVDPCVGDDCAKVTAVAAGHYHTCALMADATVRCWGSNYGGMLGNGADNGSASTPSPVAGLSGVQRIHADYTDSCAQLSDGSVRLWGANNNGQLGDGTITGRAVPTETLGFTVREMALGEYHTCALRMDGTVACWGLNWDGQVGDGTLEERHAPVAVLGLTNVKHIGAGAMHSCAILSDDTVSCWGLYASVMGSGTGSGPNELTPVRVPGLSGVVELANGGNHVCARLNDGTVSCWGKNDYGQIGGAAAQDLPTRVAGLSGVTMLESGSNHVCAFLAGGTLTCWGFNRYGQIGNGGTSESTPPTPVAGLSNVVQVSAGTTHTCAVTADGAVYCWGDELAYVGGGTVRLTPTRVVF